MREFIRQFRYGQQGFTLIELLVVVAILGILAAVVTPNVGRFMGQGKATAALTELRDVQTAITAVMAAQDPPLSSLNSSFPYSGGTATNNMAAFPNATYKLWGNPRYVEKSETEFYYTCEDNGTVRGFADAALNDEIGDEVGEL